MSRILSVHEALVARDPDAWEALYRHAYPRLLAYARRRLATRDQADDAVSEAMARAIHRIHRYAGQGDIVAWLYGILRNVILEAYRRDARSRPAVLVDLDRHDDDPLDLLLVAEETAAVRAAFALLSPADQELLELRVVGRLDAESVASVLGKRAGAVRMAQSRALSRLEAILRQVTS